jgi:hypothetical protein
MIERLGFPHPTPLWKGAGEKGAVESPASKGETVGETNPAGRRTSMVLTAGRTVAATER